MIKRQGKKVYQKIALSLVLVYFPLFGFLTLGISQHAMHHGQAHHAVQHSSWICAWICSASSFIDSDDKNISQSDDVSFEALIDRTENPVKRSSIFSFYIRPPPLSLPL